MAQCPRCGREAAELHYSHAVAGVSCEDCYCRAASPISREARRWRPLKVKVERPRPSRYAQLYEDVYAAMQRAGGAATGQRWCVFGIGSGRGRLSGWCPACGTGVLGVQIVSADPPDVRTDGCDNGCPPDL